MSIIVKKYDSNNNELAIRFGLAGIKAVGIGMVEEMVANRQEGFKDIYDFAERSGTKVINKKSLEALAKAGAFDSIHPNRNQIVESTETLCKYAASKEKESNSNQMSLFGVSNIVDEKPALKASLEWDKEKKLQEEFKAFGFFVNQHPIDDFLDDLKKRGITLSDNLESVPDDNIVKLAGVVAYSRHKSGPRGRYAYLTLSDPFGIYETAIFDEELITNSRDVMADGNNLVVECLVKRDQGGSRLLVKSIYKLEDFIKNTRPKKEAYQDIRQQERREFDWKQRAKDNKSSATHDVVAEEISQQRKIEKLKSKEIFSEVIIKITNRDSILKIKSFLSQRIAPDELNKFTKVYLAVNAPESAEVKIDLNNRYLLDNTDIEKIKLIAEVIKVSN